VYVVTAFALAIIWSVACTTTAQPALRAPTPTEATSRSGTAVSATAVPVTLPGMVGGGAKAGSAGSGAPKLDMAHTLRLVNLVTVNGTAGPALDVYAEYDPRPDATPIVRGLAYGRVSDVWHPGTAAEAAVDNPGYAIFAAGAKPGTDKPVLRDASGMHGAPARGVLFLRTPPAGSGSPTVEWLSEVDGDTAAGVKPPPASAGKVALWITSTIGDEDDAVSTLDFLTFGPSGQCLKALDDLNPSAASVWHGEGFSGTVAVDPRDSALGFWHTGAKGTHSDSDLKCQGTPAATVDVGALVPGGRAWVFLYGPEATDLKTLVLPFLP
jgi:hypothetical protein